MQETFAREILRRDAYTGYSTELTLKAVMTALRKAMLGQATKAIFL